ncbi:MAG: hypothetical protein FWC60_06890 [Firmicutes bacterium]|nr:hypothetical protein [Bacillota bacterium]
MLVPVAQARNTINRKRFLGEHERTVFSRFEVRSSRFVVRYYATFVSTRSPGP